MHPTVAPLLVVSTAAALLCACAPERERSGSNDDGPTPDAAISPDADAAGLPDAPDASPDVPPDIVPDEKVWPISDWIAIAGGTFEMGSTGADEGPVHEVSVPSFELWRTEVTVSQYRECVEAGVCDPPMEALEGFCNWEEEGHEEHPINCVSWEEARVFSAWVGGRLPSEAEWEFAARNGRDEDRWPWGDRPEPDCERVTLSQGPGVAPAIWGCGAGSTDAVCVRPLGNNAAGVCDLLGNVSEWTEDAFASYELTPTDGSAHTGDGEERVRRGGSFASPDRFVTTTARQPLIHDRISAQGGFRPAR